MLSSLVSKAGVRRVQNPSGLDQFASSSRDGPHALAAAEIRGGVERPARQVGAGGEARPDSDGSLALAWASLLKAPGAYRQPGQVARGRLCT